MKILFKKGQKPYSHKENCTCFRCSGICPWKGKSNKNFLGKKHSKLTKEIISEVHKGKHHSPESEFKNNHVPWNKNKRGYNLPPRPDNIERMSGDNNPSKRLEVREKIRKNKLGKKRPDMIGDKNHSYIDGRSKFLSPSRYGDDWNKIRYVVYLRDRFTCQHCGIIGKSLDIHHKIPFVESRDNSIENLITLCRSCHMKEERRLRKRIIVEVN